MKRIALALGLLVAFALPAMGWWTVNTFDHGYVTAAVPAEIAAADSIDITPPIVGTDTLNVRGFMVGAAGTTTNKAVAINIRYRQVGDDGWYRWSQWLEARLNYGFPLIGGYVNTMAATIPYMSSFMPIENVRLLRLFNKTTASISTVTIWYMDKQAADAVDWSTWDMPNEYK